MKDTSTRRDHGILNTIHSHTITIMRIHGTGMDRIREACIVVVQTTKACSLHTVQLMTYLATSQHVMMHTMHHNLAGESNLERILYGYILL